MPVRLSIGQIRRSGQRYFLTRYCEAKQMKLASWNINSVRLRQNLVLDRLEGLGLDVLCLQETKTEDQFFPVDAFAEAGWPHIAMRGEKSYNGVAIISRLPITENSYQN